MSSRERKLLSMLVRSDHSVLNTQIRLPQNFELRRYYTIGDGSCFFHAILASISAQYRGLDRATKIRYADGLRQDLSNYLNVKLDNGHRVYECISQSNIFSLYVSGLLNLATAIDERKKMANIKADWDQQHQLALAAINSGGNANSEEVRDYISLVIYAIREYLKSDNVNYQVANELQILITRIDSGADYEGYYREVDEIAHRLKEVITQLPDVQTAYNNVMLMSSNVDTSLSGQIAHINSRSSIGNLTPTLASEALGFDICIMEGYNDNTVESSSFTNGSQPRPVVICVHVNGHYESVALYNRVTRRTQTVFQHTDELIKRIKTQIFRQPPQFIPQNVYGDPMMALASVIFSKAIQGIGYVEDRTGDKIVEWEIPETFLRLTELNLPGPDGRLLRNPVADVLMAYQQRWDRLDDGNYQLIGRNYSGNKEVVKLGSSIKDLYSRSLAESLNLANGDEILQKKIQDKYRIMMTDPLNANRVAPAFLPIAIKRGINTMFQCGRIVDDGDLYDEDGNIKVSKAKEAINRDIETKQQLTRQIATLAGVPMPDKGYFTDQEIMWLSGKLIELEDNADQNTLNLINQVRELIADLRLIDDVYATVDANGIYNL